MNLGFGEFTASSEDDVFKGRWTEACCVYGKAMQTCPVNTQYEVKHVPDSRLNAASEQ